MSQRPEWDLEKLADSGLGCGLILLLIMILYIAT